MAIHMKMILLSLVLLVIVSLESAHGGKLLNKLTKQLKNILGGSKFEDYISDNIVHVSNIKADITNMQANISNIVDDIESNSVILSEVFENCVNEWCLQLGLTYPQYTKCESTADNGKTCIKPAIRYGNVYGPGRPRVHDGNDYNQWCRSLGGSNYVKHGEGNVGYPTNSCVYGCTSYDEVNWHWCDCDDGYWYDQSLDSSLSNFDAVISITCARNTDDIISSIQADIAKLDIVDIAAQEAQDIKIAANTANIAINAAAIANITEPTGIFRNCLTDWCLQIGLTYPQYTKCEYITDDGWTCHKPKIRYGNVYGPGRPLVNSGNSYYVWCQQLGGSTYVTHTEALTSGYPSEFCVYGCKSGDESNWHWCDCQNNYWYNEKLDSTSTNFNSVVSITCG